MIEGARLKEVREIARSAAGVPEGSALARARLLSDRLHAGSTTPDEDGHLSAAGLSALTQSGLLRWTIPTRRRSTFAPSAQPHELADVLRLVGAGDLSFARLFEGHVNAAALVARYGTAEQLADLDDYSRAGGFSGVWNAEGRRPLVANRTGEGWRLDGEKILASGAGLIRRPIVTAKTPDGIIMLMPSLPDDVPVDLSRWTPQGMRATATGTVDFSGLEVPHDCQIGAAGDYLRQPFFSGGAWRFCAVHLGAAERLVDLFRANLVARDRATDPYQKQRIAHAVAATVGAGHWLDRAARLVADETRTAEEVVAFVNLTRMVTERVCLDVLEIVHRGVGLGAFIRPDPIERISRDLATYLRQPVPDAAMADAAGTILASEASTFDLWRQ